MITAAGKSTVRAYQLCSCCIMGMSGTNIRRGECSHLEYSNNFDATIKPNSHTGHECESHLANLANACRVDAKKPTRQAAWCSRPINATFLTSLQHEGDGWGIRPHSPKSIVTALETLAEEPDEAEKFARRNHAATDLQYARRVHLRTLYIALGLSGPA
jgi:hypothetical protein